MRVAYLDPSVLRPHMNTIFKEPVIIMPKDYRVIDGDTVWIMAPNAVSHEREMAFSMRFRYSSAGEKSKKSFLERSFDKYAPETQREMIGDMAKKHLARTLSKKALIAVPALTSEGRVRKDKYGRALTDLYFADVTNDGRVDLANAQSVDLMMLKKGFNSVNPQEAKKPEKTAFPAIQSYETYVDLNAPVFHEGQEQEKKKERDDHSPDFG